MRNFLFSLGPIRRAGLQRVHDQVFFDILGLELHRRVVRELLIVSCGFNMVRLGSHNI